MVRCTRVVTRVLWLIPRIDGISHPEWLQSQIYYPGSAPHVNVAEYIFDTVPNTGGEGGASRAREEL